MNDASAKTVPGLTLANPLLPATEAEKITLIRAFACGACASSDSVGVIDAGGLLRAGSLLYNRIDKTCSCGFKTRFYLAANDLMRARSEAMRSSIEALRAAKSAGQIPDEALDLGFHSLLLSEFRGDHAASLAIAEELVLRFRQEPRAWYNLGWHMGEGGRFQEAAAAYEEVLRLDPEMADAWYNRGIMLARLGRYDHARTCLEEWARLRPEQAQNILDPEPSSGA